MRRIYIVVCSLLLIIILSILYQIHIYDKQNLCYKVVEFEDEEMWYELEITEPTYIPPGGYIPDAETAVRVAVAILAPVYGEQLILSQRPFQVSLVNELWKVRGYSKSESRTERVGRFEIDIDKISGRVVRMHHSR